MNIKLVLILLSICVTAQANPCPPDPEVKLQSRWTLQGFATPESSHYSEFANAIFVSNIDGSPTNKDSKGWIDKVSLEGKFIKKKWAVGTKKNPFHAPKGLRTHGKGQTMWVADIDRMISISLVNGKLTGQSSVPNATFLNDVEFGPGGPMVTDMMQGFIYSLSKGPSEVFLEGLDKIEHPNGILFMGDKIVIATWGREINPDFSTKTLGRLLEIDRKTKNVRAITQPIGNLDGLEWDAKTRSYFTTDWRQGFVFRVKESGECYTLFSGKPGAADLGWIPAKRMLLVPWMNEGSLEAFDVVEIK